MEKILNSQGLGISGRQNELIELALTHKFDGVEVDMEDLVGRHDTLGKHFACQFLQSANIGVGTFCLPIQLGANDETYASYSQKLDTICDLAQTLGANRCYIKIEPASADLPFQKNFEQHRTRLYDLATRFKPFSLRIGLALQAAPTIERERAHRFIQNSEEVSTLVRTIGHENVGLCLDTWQWVVGGGTLQQLSEMKTGVFTEVRMADVRPDAKLKQIKSSDRVLPGNTPDSFSLALINSLKRSGYDGPVSIASDISMFSRASRDQVVSQFSRRLTQLISGERIPDADGESSVESKAATEPEAVGSSIAE
jgi:sugar phosphate isomerase/epimerase